MMEISNLYKDFSGLKVLNGINLTLEGGERHAIIGPNGAGKSTLFNVITGKYAPSKGRILFKGEDITGLSPFKIVRKGLSRSFQIVNLFGNLSVFENIRFAVQAKNHMFFDMIAEIDRMEGISEESQKIIEAVGLKDYINVPASELSYGDQRALEIGISLASKPDLLLLDEPTGGMGSEETRKTIELIARVTQGKTLIIVEHDMEVVFALAQRITVLYYGEILVTDTPEKIRENREVKRVYLGEEDGTATIGR